MINLEQLKKFSEKPWFYPVALLLVGFTTYGYVLTSLGYYWADWEIVMFTKLNPTLQFDFYAQMGDWQKANDLTIAAQDQTPGLRKMLCANWSRLSEVPSSDTKVIEQVKQSLSC